MLAKLPSCLMVFSQKNQQNPANRPKPKPHSNKTTTTKPPNQNKTKKRPKQTTSLKQTKTPSSPCFFTSSMQFCLAFSLCSPVQQIYSSNQFLISWVVFYFFLVPHMYFSCVKPAHKCLQVLNCPCYLSAVTALFPLAELQHCSQQLL